MKKSALHPLSLRTKDVPSGMSVTTTECYWNGKMKKQCIYVYAGVVGWGLSVAVVTASPLLFCHFVTFPLTEESHRPLQENTLPKGPSPSGLSDTTADISLNIKLKKHTAAPYVKSCYNTPFIHKNTLYRFKMLFLCINLWFLCTIQP